MEYVGIKIHTTDV